MSAHEGIENELAHYHRMGVAEQDLSVQEVDGEATVTVTARGVRTMMEAAAAAGNATAARALEWVRAEEAHRTEQGADPAQAEREAVMDALEAFGANLTYNQ